MIYSMPRYLIGNRLWAPSNMPLYTFQSKDQFRDIFYPMKEAPSVGTEIIDEQGVTWRRVFTCPNAAINSVTYDPNSASDFNRRFDGKKVLVGDMWDASREASIQRGGASGEDHVKTKYYDDYAKERKGVRHKTELKEKTDKQMVAVRKEISKILPT